jgi:phage terminase large subunit-like protein
VRWPGVTRSIPAVWAPRRRRWESPDGAYYFDAEAAEFAEDFFPTFLQHHIGEFNGRPFVLMDYQRLLVVRPLFGWKRTLDGLRRFRKVFLAVPKGNGKSPFGAGLGLFGAFFDGEPGAEVYAVAADRKQAGIVFDSAKVMTERNEYLAERCEVFRDSIKLIGSTESFQVLSSDAGTKHGFRPHFIIFDEFHAQPNRDLFDALYRGMGKRRQPVLFMITTAGDDDESICFEEWDYARRVVTDSVPDEVYLPVLFEARPDEDWAALATVQRVNPGYGITMKAGYFETEIAAAQAEPRKRNAFIQLHTNRWVNQAVAWLPIEWWDAATDPVPPDAALALLPCAAGLDLAQKYDLACLAVAFRQALPAGDVIEVVGETPAGGVVTRRVELNYRLVVVPFFWIPEDTMREREKDDGIPYSIWAAQGLVTPTPGGVIDYTRIYDDIRTKIAPRFPRLKQGGIGYDPAFATDLATKLRDLAGFPVLEVLQNYTHLSEPAQIVEALIKAHRITHGGHRTLRNHVENVAIKTDDAGRIRPVKPKKLAGKKRIDGVVALIMAVKQLATVPDVGGLQFFIAGGRK